MKVSKSRRKFLSTSLKAGAFAGLFSNTLLASETAILSQSLEHVSKSNHPLNILILGGTSFLGPYQIAYALKRGHSISIFTRGKTIPTVHQNLLKNVEHLIGDRENDLEALKNRKWDAVIDNSGRKVEWTQATAELLKDHVKTYMYTSSTGVFYPYLTDDIKEDTKLVLELPDSMDENQKLEYGYGVMKSNSELAAKQIFGEDRTIVVRPTYMIGPGDRMDRFNYWPVRLDSGGEIMVPGNKFDPVQYIDVRDVAEWMIRLLESNTIGTFNTAGPASKTTMEAFMHGAKASFGVKSSFTWIDNYEFLKKNGVHYIVPWIMPEGENYGSARVNIDLALENGLTFRPLSDTIRDIMHWWNSPVISQERRKNLTDGEKSIMKREKDILKAWKNS